MSGLQIMALLSGMAGLGATIGATVSNEWKTTSRASSVITATWVFQGLWMNCAGNAIGAGARHPDPARKPKHHSPAALVFGDHVWLPWPDTIFDHRTVERLMKLLSHEMPPVPRLLQCGCHRRPWCREPKKLLFYLPTPLPPDLTTSPPPKMSSMATEILAFVLSISGWVLISSTLPTDYWKVSSIDGTVITTATFWSNLWKTCVTDSTGVSNCKDFPSMLALDGLTGMTTGAQTRGTMSALCVHPPGDLRLCAPRFVFSAFDLTRKTEEDRTAYRYIQVCRGLMISAVCLGFFGSIFSLVGMKCTKIGGSDKTKARIACLAGFNFILSGLCSLTACSLYAHRITSEFFDPMFIAQKFELGAALFIGWAGSVLCILGGTVFCFSLAEGFSSSSRRPEYMYSGAQSYMSSHPKANSKVTESAPKAPPDYSGSSRQFGKNAY
ncbi:hypothetical protein JZ751_004460, partial [Albula glossodonta]